MSLLLTRRRVQLNLLAEACAHRCRARVAPAGQTPDAAVVNTRFLALEPDALLLEWPSGGSHGVPPHDAAVDVFFEHERQRFACRTATQGRSWWHCTRRGRVAAWRLAVPLRVESGQQRAHYRVSLADLGPVKARFASVADPSRSFLADVTNISGGGLGATAPALNGKAAQPGELFWVRFTLPDDREPFEFVVRLVHCRDLRQAATVVLGGTFCPGEDPAAHHARLARIERFVLARDMAKLRRSKERYADGV